MKWLEFIARLPFMLLGWLLSVIYTGFRIGWETNQFGEFKMKSIANLRIVIDRLIEKN